MVERENNTKVAEHNTKVEDVDQIMGIRKILETENVNIYSILNHIYIYIYIYRMVLNKY